MKSVFRKLNFRILSIFKHFHIIKAVKLFWCGFFGNKILESERDLQNSENIYLRKFPANGSFNVKPYMNCSVLFSYRLTVTQI